jgi:hypothetical protein
MLALMAIGPVVTWCMIVVEPVRSVSSSRAVEQLGAGREVPSMVQTPVIAEADSAGFEEARPAAAEVVEVPAPTSEVDVDSASETSASATLPGQKHVATASVFRESIEMSALAIKPYLPILVGVWLLGVLICSVRPVWGLWLQWRLRRVGLRPVPETIHTRLNALIQRLRLTRAVRIAESALVKVPLVVGYLHPMILLPASVDILCLGPEEDWFVRVTRFQENGPFVHQSVYYRIGESVVPSLKYHHYPNSNSWSRGPEKITRHGNLNFEFPDVRSDYADLPFTLQPQQQSAAVVNVLDAGKSVRLVDRPAGRIRQNSDAGGHSESID